MEALIPVGPSRSFPNTLTKMIRKMIGNATVKKRDCRLRKNASSSYRVWWATS